MRISLRRVAGAVAGIVVACGGVSACGAASGHGGGRSGDATASASPTKKGPGGPGGKLLGGIWTFDSLTLTVDGKEVQGHDSAVSPWVEFRDDGTVAGNYGCTPFHVKAKLEATTLTWGDDLPALPSPSATPAPPTGAVGACQTPEQQQEAKAGDFATTNEEVADFEAKVKKFFHRGPLKITEKKLERQPGGPPPGSLPQLRNEHGDLATLSVVRAPGFFDTTYHLQSWTVYDHTEDFESAKDNSFAFHRDGTVTGNLGCNDFTARAYFNGSHVFFRDTRLTTHRTCAAQNMRDERSIVGRLQNSLNYGYVGNSSVIYMADDYTSEDRKTGLNFQAVTEQ
ncbi:META domain-containing protein [Streptomyces sp. NPDC057555]|uniref:META domain-containing protein n=1 Tax=Streptomyces sp. NPDC057555 TaxID=3346166 RepID=UPI0036C5B81B